MSCQFLYTKGWVCKTVEYFDTSFKKIRIYENKITSCIIVYKWFE